MKLRKFIMTLLLLTPTFGIGQTITSINFPTDLCAGSDTTVSFGYDNEFNIVVDTLRATLSRADRAFLPDGIPCGGVCSYASPITFSDFAPGAAITSAQNIRYVRLNMEHSFIGDIYISLECPNGQRVSLMNWAGTGSSQCSSTVPQGNRSWSSGNNTWGSTYFGEAYDYSGSPKCDSTIPANAPGIGWNYCWSNSNSPDFTYAPGDALIYRSANEISHYNTFMHGTRTTIDSSNVAAGTNFYHPQDNFSNLVGCPLNGQWSIEVIDAYGTDNGYIFEWELSLESYLLPNPCQLTDKLIISDFCSRIDDTNFAIHVPETITADTTVQFTIMIINSCNETIDTTVEVVFHPNVAAEAYDTVCESFTFRDSTYTASDTVQYHTPSQYGCDSLTTLNFTIAYNADTLYRDTTVENDLPYIFNNYPIHPHVEQSTIILDTTTVMGCDSTITLLLTVGFNKFDTLTDTICRHSLPYIFDDVELSPIANDTIVSLFYTSALGADSTSTVLLHVNPDDSTTIADTVEQNQLPVSAFGYYFNRDTDTLLMYTNRFGCDSTVRYMLHVWQNVDTTIDSTVCRHQLPVLFNGLTLHPAANDTTVSVVLANMHGADSTITFQLHINPDYSISVADTLVENLLPAISNGVEFNNPADTVFNLTSMHGCDSTVRYTLHVWFNDNSTTDTITCRHELPLLFNGVSVAPAGADTTLAITIPTEHGADSTITLNLHVNPDNHTEVSDTVVENQLPVTFGGAMFSHAADTTFMYTNQYGCDSSVHYTLHIWSNYAATFDTSVCDNLFPIRWHNVDFDGPDTVVLNLKTIHGADSTLTLRIHAYPTYDISIQAGICDNQSYTLGGRIITTPGEHKALLASVHGCDSLVTLNLTVWPTYAQYFTDTVCATSGIDFDGVHYVQSGTYVHNHPTIHGCDSLLTLKLDLRGLNLKAKAQIVPLIPTPENLNIELRDVSRAAVDRRWFIGDFCSNLTHVKYTYPEELDSVEAMLIAYSHDECADTAITVIRIDRSTLFAPNAFTPNQESNAHWQLIGMQVENLTVWIYNRQGNLVYTYSGIDGSWDGSDLNGNACQQGAYVYKAEYNTLLHRERKQTITGTILLIR